MAQELVSPVMPEPEVEAEKIEPPAEPEISRWPLYVGLGLGNILIMGLAFFAYRMIMGSSKGDGLKDLEQAVEDSEQLADAEPQDEPQMEEIPATAGEAQSDADLAAQLAADMEMGSSGLDLASDEVTDADIPELSDEAAADDLLADLGEDPFADMSLGDDEPAESPEPDTLEDEVLSDEASIEDALEGFSLDDFSEDDLDSLGGEEPKE